MEFLIEWVGIALIVLLATASPGPDFVIVVRNAVIHSKRVGIFTAVGITVGNCIHVTYCILGIAALISQSLLLFSMIKYVGAAYLIYIGFKALYSQGYKNTVVGDDKQECVQECMPIVHAVRQGFLTNLLNPKATMFWFALFTQVISPDTSLFVRGVYGVTAVTISFFWFFVVSVVLNQRSVRRVFLSWTQWIDRICGGLMVALGVKLALIK